MNQEWVDLRAVAEVEVVDGPTVALVVVPVTSAIPFLVSSGILLVMLAVVWGVFGLAIVRSRPT
jgi:hypothetical protein